MTHLMLKHITILSTQMSSFMCVFFLMEGMAWIDKGFGIHPVAAGALAVAMFLLPHLLRKWI